MSSEKLENYRALLVIRLKASRRDAIFTGGIFLISFLSVIALGMLDRLTPRSLFLAAALEVCFGLGALTTWVRFEIIKASIELVDNLS